MVPSTSEEQKHEKHIYDATKRSPLHLRPSVTVRVVHAVLRLGVHGRGRAAHFVEIRSLRLIGTCGGDAHGGGGVRGAGGTSSAEDDAAPDNDADDDKNEDEATNEDVRPAGEHFLLVPAKSQEHVHQYAIRRKVMWTYIFFFSSFEIGECCILSTGRSTCAVSPVVSTPARRVLTKSLYEAALSVVDRSWTKGSLRSIDESFTQSS